jgi:colanic acid/amylovoran biosynthesis protein
VKVYVDVYLAKNLGDDLFIHILSNRFPNAKFVVNYYGDDYDEFLANYSNVKKSEYPIQYKLLNRMKIYDYINDANRLSKEYDVLIFLGGSIFREEDYWKDLYKVREKMLQAFRKKGKPVLVLGANFGPFYSNEFLEAYHDFFSSCHDVCFREKYSKQLFSDISVVRSESDIVFQLDVKKRNKKDQIVYSVIEPNHKEGLEEYREKYIWTLSESIKNSMRNDFKCVLMSFCKKEGDLQICEEIVESLPEEIRNKIDIINYDGDIETTLNIIAESKLIVASRFHANILGILCNTKVLPLVYSDKTSNVLKENGFDNEIVKIEQCDKILEENFIQGILNNDKQFKRDKVIYESAKSQFDVLEKIFNDKR